MTIERKVVEIMTNKRKVVDPVKQPLEMIPL